MHYSNIISRLFQLISQLPIKKIVQAHCLHVTVRTYTLKFHTEDDIERICPFTTTVVGSYNK